jgi:OTU domain-containing protein 6
MTAEMDERHERELLDFKSTDVSVDLSKVGLQAEVEPDTLETPEAAAEAGEDEPRVSKAQKRRDKKAQKEKERLEEIEKQVGQNMFGARQLEIDGIAARLKAKKLLLHTVQSDGDCMFAAIAHQLQIKKVVMLK